MKQPVTISLIAAIYRVEEYIADFAESVLSQSYPHIQFIFVNDETDDASVDILNSVIDAKYQHLRDRILVVDQPHAGLPAARSTGLQYVTGDYIWHIDSDDWIEKDAVAKIAAVAEETGSDLIYFNFYQEYSSDFKIKKERVYTIDRKEEYIWNMYNQKAYACVWNKCVRTSVYRMNDVVFPKYSYAEDTYLMTQLVSYSTSITCLDEALYHYRKNNRKSLSHQRRRRRRLEYSLNFLDMYENYLAAPSTAHPVVILKDAILLRAGWYSIAYGLGLFDRFPYLSRQILHAGIHRHAKVGIVPQMITKFLSWIRIYNKKD